MSGTTNCYCGGAIGYEYSTAGIGSVSSTVSYGNVVGGNGSALGGFVGFDASWDGFHNAFANDGWDMTTSGITDPSEGAGNVANDPGITGFN